MRAKREPRGPAAHLSFEFVTQMKEQVVDQHAGTRSPRFAMNAFMA
jgi:hypothetical protein